MDSLRDITNRQSAAIIGLVMACVCSFSGCRSAAHEDLYVDQLTSEIRFLEDQLYEIDYENRILREKLARAKGNDRSELPPPRRRTRIDQDRERTGTPDDLEIESGQREPPRIRTPESPPEDYEAPLIQLGDPASDSSPAITIPEGNSSDGFSVPNSVTPDGGASLAPPVIDSGELVPPGGVKDNDPGRLVEIPTASRRLFSEPAGPLASIKIDSNRSHSHSFDGERDDDGILLFVRGFDSNGKPVPIELPIEVAVLDPELSESEMRLGRWAIDPAVYRRASHQSATEPGVQIPVRWKDRRPSTQQCVVFCRVEIDGEKVVAQSNLSLDAPRTQLWTPSMTR